MDTKDLIDLVIDYLPDQIKDDNLFMDLKAKYFDISKGARLVGHIAVDSNLYEEIIENNPELAPYFSVSELRTLRVSAMFKGNLIILNILEFGEDFAVTMHGALGKKDFTATLEKLDDERTIKIKKNLLLMEIVKIIVVKLVFMMKMTT